MSESPVGVPGLVVSCASFDVTQELKGIFHVSTGWPHDLVSRLPAQLVKCLKVPKQPRRCLAMLFLRCSWLRTSITPRQASALSIMCTAL